MKSFQPLKKSWKKTFTDIKKAKYIFIILFFTQLIFLIIISMIFFKYATEIGEAGRLAAEPIQGGALETPEALLANADTILQNYKAMIKNIVFLFIGILLSYLFINSINWDLTYVLANKKFSYLRYLRKFILFTIIFTLPALIVMAVIFNVFQEPKLAAILAGSVGAVVLYFMYISFALIDAFEYTPSSIKKHLKNTFSLGIKHWIILLTTYLIIVIPLVLWIVLIFYVKESQILLLLGSLVLFILCINIGRLFLINIAKELK